MKKESDLCFKAVEDQTLRAYLQKELLDELGQVEYLNFPVVGPVEAGQVVVNIEAEKATIEIPVEVSGTIVKLNHLLEDQPQSLSKESVEDDWLFEFIPA